MSGERDLQAERDHAEFAGWFQAQGFSAGGWVADSMAEAFTAGMQAARDLGAAEDGSAGDVHVDWHMTLAEWDELRGVLIRNTGYEYIGRLEAAGALKRPLSSRDGAVAQPQPAPSRAELETAMAREPQPAPELAAAMAETRGLRELVTDMLAAFTVTGSGHSARVGQVQIAKWRERAGLPS